MGEHQQPVHADMGRKAPALPWGPMHDARFFRVSDLSESTLAYS